MRKEHQQLKKSGRAALGEKASGANPKIPSWRARLQGGAVFFLASCAVLSAIRLFFFFRFRSGAVDFADFLPALSTGLRLDAKWLAILLLPAWASAVLAAPFPRFFHPLSRALALIGLAAAAIASVVNVGFYEFYGTPISSIIFGLFQDDTKAIVKTLASDWPVFSYAAAIIGCIALPCLASKFCPRSKRPDSRVFTVLSAIAATAILACCIRGSFGTFPLRMQDFAVSPIPFVNDAVPNGPAALYEAAKEQKALSLKGGPLQGLKDMGFRSPEEAMAALPGPAAPAAPAAKPHVVFAVMESMGRDQFELHGVNGNDTQGALALAAKAGFVFRKGIGVKDGTFPSVEGLLYDTPITPISQSRYGYQRFPFSNAFAYKDAGYRTVFLTSGPENWRDLDRSLLLQGFGEVLGAQAVRARFPEAEMGTWGVGDEWTFKLARELLSEADGKGEKLFLMILSATNHPPYRVPDGRPLVKADWHDLPDFIVRNLPEDNLAARMQTYRYAANALGEFVLGVERSDLASRTLIAATGDHNARFTYKPDGWWPHANGVPVLFWIPEAYRGGFLPDTGAYVSSRDVFPTLSALALGRTPLPWQGRNLFAPLDGVPADAFTGLANQGYGLSAAGAATAEKGGKTRCYAWQGPKLVPAECSPALARTGEIARAKRAMADFTVRKSLLAGAKN